jgi:hypothetical protein
MKRFNDQIEGLHEQYTRNSIPIKTSIRAPRHLKLSEEFVEAFQREYSRLEAEYTESSRSKKKLLNELSKSLQFLVP